MYYKKILEGLLYPPSHSRYATLGTLAPITRCFGWFRYAKKRRLEVFCLATFNYAGVMSNCFCLNDYSTFI